MKPKVKLADLLMVVAGLVGAVLIWLRIDSKGTILYWSFLFFGSSRIIDFFGSTHFERNNLKETLKLVTCVLITIIASSHLIAGGKPMFGVLSLAVLLLAFATLEPQSNTSESEIS